MIVVSNLIMMIIINNGTLVVWHLVGFFLKALKVISKRKNGNKKSKSFLRFLF